MSRETDSSSSGPQGRGGAAYPSGTPPYGSRQYPSPADAEEAAAEPRPEEPRTETTLTTRIRINIPGSRPIPPVVMRTPVGDADAVPAEPQAPGAPAAGPAQDRAAERPRKKAQGAAAGAQAAGSGGGKPAGEKEKPSDWFAPRKSGPAAGAGQGEQDAPANGSAPAGAPQVPGLPYFSDADRPAGAPGAAGVDTRPPLPERPVGPTTGPAAGTSALSPRSGDFGPAGAGGTNGAGTSMDGFAAGAPRKTAQAQAQAPQSQGYAPAPYDTDTGAHDTGTHGVGAHGPGGHGTGGHDTGSHNIGSHGTGSHDTGGHDTGSHNIGSHGTGSHDTGSHDTGGFHTPAGGFPLTSTPPAGTPAATVPRLSDDTAVLTPQRLVPDAGGAPGSHVSGATLTSGVPVAQPTGPDLTPRLPDAPHGPGSPAGPPAPPAQAKPASPAPARKKKGRSKIALLGVGVFVIAGGAYGAGLLLNHSDVPKGTTVLGVDIGGSTRDEAVNKLDTALGKRASAPIQLTVGGKKEQLSPDKAGLKFDALETVRAAAGSDYNPVSVIGSLFGGAREADPVIPVDEEKLGVALTDLAGASGSATEGTIKFEPNKVVAVPGKAGKALDVQRSMQAVKDAYRAQVETGRQTPVELPVGSKQPTIGQAELDRAMKEFAEPAMSDVVYINAGGKQIKLGPGRSFPKILSMKPVNGRLVESYDKKAIEELCGSTFDGVFVAGDGGKRKLGPDDVVKALKKAVRGKTPADRTVTIETA
ncbi:hypothetical protein [Streptomyces sp. NPDC050504]|uniref:hypothetical protein n=1 Tax=Streptomyces sp. NPDC050504 TaxID=3365618 RepID=UPI0037A67E94